MCGVMTWSGLREFRVERTVEEALGVCSLYLRATDGQSLYFTWQQTFSDIWVMDIVEGDQ